MSVVDSGQVVEVGVVHEGGAVEQVHAEVEHGERGERCQEQ